MSKRRLTYLIFNMEQCDVYILSSPFVGNVSTMFQSISVSVEHINCLCFVSLAHVLRYNIICNGLLDIMKGESFTNTLLCMIFQYVNGDNSRYQIYTCIEFQSFLVNQGIAYRGQTLWKIIGGAINNLHNITRLAAMVQCSPMK